MTGPPAEPGRDAGESGRKAARDYEKLTGAEGRKIYFRAERHRPRRLLDRIPPDLEIDGLGCRLYDLSATGLSCDVPSGSDGPVQGAIVRVSIRLDRVVAFDGEGEVVRQQAQGDGTRIALRFMGDHVLPARLKQMQDQVAFDRALSNGLDAYAAVPQAYRAVCGEARLFLEHWRQLLDGREAGIREADVGDAAAQLAHIETEAIERMRPEWEAIHARANAASIDITAGDALEQSKRYTETLLTHGLRDVPLMWRTYTKPQGYPGDFVSMSWMYDGRRRGDSVFARAMDQLGHEERLAATVVVRKRFLVEQLAATVTLASARHGDPVRIVSIGSGPAREVVDFLMQTAPGPRIEFVLIDQDEDALGFAAESLLAAAQAHGDRVTVACRHLSFGQLFTLPHLLAEVAQADLIYTAGLFDYLSEPVGRMLMNGCFGLLRDGGRLVIGNAKAGPDIRWMPEFVLDWTMVYRTREELLGLASDFADRASLEIATDDSAAWLFLVAEAHASSESRNQSD